MHDSEFMKETFYLSQQNEMQNATKKHKLGKLSKTTIKCYTLFICWLFWKAFISKIGNKISRLES